MMLHIPTLLMVAVFVFCLMSLLTVHAWSRGREPTRACRSKARTPRAVKACRFSR